MFKAVFGDDDSEEFRMNTQMNPYGFHDQISISESANHMIMQTPRDFTNQSNMAEVLMSLPPLGLKLHKAPSFMDLIETKLYPQQSNSNTSMEKKASNADIFMLNIGSWQRVARNKEDLVAKCYFAKRKLMWEILENGLKKKIQMPWESISAIRADIRENFPGILEIELSRPPSFFHETEPQPRKHTLWDTSADFTAGQASTCRRHSLRFPPGALDKLYEKLLRHEPRFVQMSQRPFPSHGSPFFDSVSCEYGHQISFGFASETLPPVHVQRDHSGAMQCDNSFFLPNDFSPTSVMDLCQLPKELPSVECQSNDIRFDQRVDNCNSNHYGQRVDYYSNNSYGNSECSSYPQSLTWPEAQESLAYNDSTQFVGMQNLVHPWMEY